MLFGINDRKKIIGQEVADTTKRNIADAVSRLEPTAAVQIFYVPLPDSDRKVIALHVEDTRLNRPFSYKGRPYMRVESMTTTMPQAAYERLLLQRDGGKYRWEQFDNEDLALQDIDGNEVLKTVRLGIECGRLPEDTGNDIPVILEKFGLMRNGVLNHAAAVLFGKHENMEYPQCFYAWPVSEVSTRRYSWITSVYKETFFSCSMQQWHLFSNISHCQELLILWSVRNI